MRPTCGSTLRRILPLTVLVLACADPTSSGPQTAVFVLRSISGNAVPATILLGAAPYAVLADTLFVDPPDAADGSGVLQRSVAGAYLPAVPQFTRGAHRFVWRGADLSVFFGCQVDQMCVEIYSYHHGTISGRELRFPASGPFAPERLYERVR